MKPNLSVIIMLIVAPWANDRAWAQAGSWPEATSANFVVDTAIYVQDTDGDGMPDAWELAHGLDINAVDAHLNPDGDAYTNIQEYNAGLDPQVAEPTTLPQAASLDFILSMVTLAADTDADGLPDPWELANGLSVGTDDSAEDPDGDGLTNLEEFNGGWNPQLNEDPLLSRYASALATVDTGASPFGFATDTDGDGMPDWWEIKYGLDRLVNDSSGDLDLDGLSNLEEYLLGTLPDQDDLWGVALALSAKFLTDTIGLPPDTDGDGMRDWWEMLHNLDHLVNDAELDPDGDGRTNLEEYNANTDPHVDDWRGPSQVASLGFTTDTGGFNGGFALDTDGDGMPDWWEIKYGLSTTTHDASGNPDGDALTNLEEYNAGSNPQHFDFLIIDTGEGHLFVLDTGGRWIDSDHDGMPNWWERLHTGNSTNMLAHLDADLDGHSNLEEFISKFDPHNPNSVFTVRAQHKVEEQPAEWVITWDTAPDRRYSVHSHGDLSSMWPSSPVYQVDGDGTPKSYTNTNQHIQPRYYRVGVEIIQ